MSDQLPPSRFGAGYTYGGDQPDDRTQRIQQPPPPPPQGYGPDPGNAPTTAYPSYSQPSDPYAGGQYGPPSYSPPPQYGQGAQYGHPPQYGQPPPGYSSAPTASRSGGAAAVGGVLAIVAGIAHIGWAIPMYLYISKNTSGESGFVPGSSDPWQAKWTVYSSFAQTAFGVLLLVGGILLVSRKGGGRGLSAVSSIVVIGISIASVVIGYMYVHDLAEAFSSGENDQTNKLLFIWNPVFFWSDPETLSADSLSSRFTMQLVAFIALMVVSVGALIGALAAKPPQRTAALGSSPYGY